MCDNHTNGLYVSPVEKKQNWVQKTSENLNETIVYLNNLLPDVKEEQIQKKFEKFGKINGLNLRSKTI